MVISQCLALTLESRHRGLYLSSFKATSGILRDRVANKLYVSHCGTGSAISASKSRSIAKTDMK
jgi:hypothetical protein